MKVDVFERLRAERMVMLPPEVMARADGSVDVLYQFEQQERTKDDDDRMDGKRGRVGDVYIPTAADRWQDHS